MAEAVSRRPLTREFRVHSQASLSGMVAKLAMKQVSLRDLGAYMSLSFHQRSAAIQ